MTVASTYAPPHYAGDGTTRAFAFPFPFFAPGDLVVTLWDVSALAWVANVTLNGGGTYGYTITATADPATGMYPSATITFTTAPIGGAIVGIQRAQDGTQTASLANGGPFPAKTVEAALDRVTLLAQQAIAAGANTLRVPAGDAPLAPFGGGASRAMMLVGFAADGSAALYPVASTSASDASTSVVTSTGGTTPRALSSRFTRNPEDFGARGDGSTDDTTAINAAIAGGGLVVFQDKTYIVSGELVAPANTYILGLGRATIKLKDHCGTIPTELLGNPTAGISNVVVENITFDGNWTNNIDHGTPDGAGNQSNAWTGSLAALVNFYEVTNLSIRNCQFINSWGSGIWITNCYNTEVVGNKARNCRLTAFAIRDYTVSTTVLPYYTRVLNNFVDTTDVGIQVIFGPYGGAISGNTPTNCRNANCFPSFAYSGTYPNIWPSTGGFKAYGIGGYVSAAQIGDGSGIEFTGGAGYGGNSDSSWAVTGNVAINNAVGIRGEEATQYISISGNTCSNNDFYGIEIYVGLFTAIGTNECNGNGIAGIIIQKQSGFATIPAEFAVSGNTLIGNGLYGLQLVAVAGAAVTGNTISGNNTTANANGGAIGLFDLDGHYCIDSTIVGNRLANYYGGDNYGIYSSSASNAGNIVVANRMTSFNTAQSNLSITANQVSLNLGWATAARGSATIASGTSSIVVAFTLPATPASGQISVTPTANPGAGLSWWIDTIGASAFTIHTSSNVAANTSFNWSIAEVA